MTAAGTAPPLARAVIPIVVLTLVWGCNWPILKIGVSELPPLTFRGLTLPFAAVGMLLVARCSGAGGRRALHRDVPATCEEGARDGAARAG